MQIEYNDTLETLVDKVNKELEPRGLQFVADDDKTHSGFVVYELIEIEA